MQIGSCPRCKRKSAHAQQQRCLGLQFPVAILERDQHFARGTSDADTAGHIEFAAGVGEVERCGECFELGLVDLQSADQRLDLSGAFQDARGNRRITTLRIGKKRIRGPRVGFLLGDGSEADFAKSSKESVQFDADGMERL